METNSLLPTLKFERKFICDGDQDRTWYEIRPADQQFGSIATVNGDQRDAEAIAAHIVRAVNAHDELMEACREAENMITMDMDALRPDVAMHSFAALDLLRAALAKADGR